MKPARRPAGGTARTGADAEDAALAFLLDRGLRLVARNFRCRAGELDLVMDDGGTLVFVEVRSRESTRIVDPAATISIAKRRRLLRAAAGFLQRSPAWAAGPLRFDVLALTGPPEMPRCRWIRRAFTTDGVGGF